MKNSTNSKFKTGMYLLETLTAGMYNEPLAIYREYIQNAVDSIDMIQKGKQKCRVDIQLDPFEQRITISDNGYGIPSEHAEEILNTLGGSQKINSDFRGFRGIGRLGGIAYSDKATFRTKSDGEAVESVQEWDCIKLRQILNAPKNSKMSLAQLIDGVSTFHTQKVEKKRGSYFTVALDGVSSFRNQIFDVQKVYQYLSEIAPVDFDPNEFSFGLQIDDWLTESVTTYGTYDIFLNDRQIFKPYKDELRTTNKGTDSIQGIEKITIEMDDQPIAQGWYGIRRNLLGAIAKGEFCSGIRVRSGNILIGDSHLLDGCFRENRFNSYVVGEIHVCTPDLIPNSRRDDFVDNRLKTQLFNQVDKEIGLPLSKEIRKASRVKSKKKSKTEITQVNSNHGEIQKRMLSHPNVNDIIADIFSKFISNKDFKQIIDKYDLAQTDSVTTKAN